MIVEIRETYYNSLDAMAKKIASYDITSHKMSESLLRTTAELYTAAKVEKKFDNDTFSSAYHSPITGELEFLIGRILYWFSRENELEWTIHLRRQKASTAPDIRIDKYGLTVGIIEIKAKAGWMQGFFSPEQFERDKAKFDSGERDYDPEAGNQKSKNQLTKYGRAFGIKPTNIFLLLPTLALVHRKKSSLALDIYRSYFAQTSGIPKENLVLLSSNLGLDLSYRLGDLEPTGEFEAMLKRLVSYSEHLPVTPPAPTRRKTRPVKLIEENQEKKIRANSKSFIASKYSKFFHLPRRTSRMWERSESPDYNDNWWFNFYLSDLENAEAIVLAGARDYINENFSLMKVPRSFILDNLSKLDVNADGWVNLYIGMNNYVDQRRKGGLCFREFLVN